MVEALAMLYSWINLCFLVSSSLLLLRLCCLSRPNGLERSFSSFSLSFLERVSWAACQEALLLLHSPEGGSYEVCVCVRPPRCLLRCPSLSARLGRSSRRGGHWCSLCETLRSLIEEEPMKFGSLALTNSLARVDAKLK